MTEIRPGLLLGNMRDALAAASGTSGQHKVTHVLTLASSPPEWRLVLAENEHVPFATMFVAVTDQPSSDLLSHFESCARFIRKAEDEGESTVLVHCEHGISRSPTVVIAYLMWKECVSLQVAMAAVRGKKPDISPNIGFMEQLNLWDQMNGRIDCLHKGYKAYKLRRVAHEIKDPFVKLSESVSYFRCRKCRRLLFTESSVLLHPLGSGQEAFGWHKRQMKVAPFEVERPGDEMTGDGWEHVVDSEGGTTLGGAIAGDHKCVQTGGQMMGTQSNEVDDISVLSHKLSSMANSDASCSSHFIEPVEWMEPVIIGCLQGKLSCPKCAARLGSFDWAGVQCSCGRWITPAFQIHKNKVDETKTLTKRKITSS